MSKRPWYQHYEPGVPPSIRYEDVTISQMLERAVARWGTRPAIVFQNGRLSYAEFKEEVDRLATAMARLGVEKGSRVAIHMPNLPQTVIAVFATMRLGAIAVMTNPLYTSREIEHQWNDAGATVALVMDFLFTRTIEPVRERLRVEHYVIASIPEYLRFPLNLLAPFKLRKADPPMLTEVAPSDTVHHFRKLIRATPASPPDVELEMDDIAMLQYTGGTTGVSKGAMLTHRNMSANVQQTSAWNTGIEEGKDVLIACLPYFHIYGLTISMLIPTYVGAAMVMIPNPRDIEGLVKSIVKHRATLVPAVPAMFNGINQLPDIEKYDLSTITSCNSGSAPLPVDVLHRFEELTGAKISEGYGLTETSPVTHSNPPFGKRKVGSIGLPLPDTDTKIVDLEDGTTEVAVGEPGELLLKGPQVMKGYWNKPEETDKMLRDGWLYTGDIAKMDEEGYHYIVGRKKDMILCSGYNVYPDEIDRVLVAHPDILEAATIGVPDERRGETVKSFVVLQSGANLSVEEVGAYARENLAAYKVPREIEFRDNLPKSTVLKILRRQLRDEEMQKRGG